MRLLIWILATNLVQTVVYLIELFLTGPGFWCTASPFIIALCQNVTNFLMMFIAINLQLIFVMHVSTAKFEIWYLSLSWVVAFVSTIIPVSRGVFGWDDIGQECYVTLPSGRSRLDWEIEFIYVWTLGSTFFTVISVCVTLLQLSLWQARRRHIVGIQADTVATSEEPQSPTIRESSIIAKCALRIVFYPIIMVIVNVCSATSDLKIDIAGGINTSGIYWLWVVYSTLSGCYGGTIALVTMFVDPSLTRGLRAWYRIKTGKSDGLSDGSWGDRRRTLPLDKKIQDPPRRDVSKGWVSTIRPSDDTQLSSIWTAHDDDDDSRRASLDELSTALELDPVQPIKMEQDQDQHESHQVAFDTAEINSRHGSAVVMVHETTHSLPPSRHASARRIGKSEKNTVKQM